MKLIANKIVLTIIVLLSTLISSAQVFPADVKQNKLMKDSLQLSDSVIQKVVILRQYYLSNTSLIRYDSTLTNQQQDDKITIIRNQTNEGIKNAMGDDKYEKYKLLIKGRMKTHNSNGRTLAAEDNR